MGNVLFGVDVGRCVRTPSIHAAATKRSTTTTRLVSRLKVVALRDSQRRSPASNSGLFLAPCLTMPPRSCLIHFASSRPLQRIGSVHFIADIVGTSTTPRRDGDRRHRQKLYAAVLSFHPRSGTTWYHTELQLRLLTNKDVVPC